MAASMTNAMSMIELVTTYLMDASPHLSAHKMMDDLKDDDARPHVLCM
jgi:hypothetical protein